jgi:DNA segregation ATPase FtsK/SpoIIIE-like protein
MDESVKVILKKLDDIDSRLKNLETPGSAAASKAEPQVKVERDPLFSKALEIIDKSDEVSSIQLQEALRVDKARAEKIMDQLEAAGFGTCYMKEA